VNWGIIPDKNYRAVDDEEQMRNELDDMAGAYVLRMDAKVRADIIDAALKRDGPDRREAFSGSGVFDDSGPAAHAPCRMTHRSHLKPRLVLENQGRAESRDFFLMRGHSTFIQLCISFSSRSDALRCGLCQEKPI